MKIRAILLALLLFAALLGGAYATGDPPPEPTPKPPPTPLGPLELYSETAVLMDAQSGQILLERDMDKPMFPASTTKVMTALLALEQGELTDIVTVSQTVVDRTESDSTHMNLAVGEELTLEQLLYATLLYSANDAACAIAEHIDGSIEAFAQRMNAKAKELGCENTNFVNPNGMPDEAHVTTARDLALILREAIKDPMFIRISGTLQYRIPPTNKFTEERALNHTHSMIKPRQGSDYPYEGVLAGKTGFTQASQNTLATAAQRDGRSLIAVTLSSPDGNDRYEDTVRLLDYGFTQFGRFSVTGSDLDPMTDTLVLADGDLWQVAVTTGGTLELLTENTVTAADLVLSCELNAMMQNGDSVSVQISLPEDDPRMYGALGELPGTLQLVNNLSAPAPDAETEPDAASPAPVPEDGDAEDSAASDPAPDAAKSENGFWYVLRLILVGLLVLAAGGFIVILVMRTLNIRRHKKRMQARRRR